MRTVHATAVAIDDKGVLLRGPSGSGKSDLALRLIDDGALLIADDRTGLTCRNGNVIALRPEEIAGKLEVRGVGIIKIPSIAEAAISVVVDLVDPHSIERLPECGTAELLGCRIPRIAIAPFENSAPAKIRTAVRYPAEYGTP